MTREEAVAEFHRQVEIAREALTNVMNNHGTVIERMNVLIGYTDESILPAEVREAFKKYDLGQWHGTEVWEDDKYNVYTSLTPGLARECYFDHGFRGFSTRYWIPQVVGGYARQMVHFSEHQDNRRILNAAASWCQEYAQHLLACLPVKGQMEPAVHTQPKNKQTQIMYQIDNIQRAINAANLTPARTNPSAEAAAPLRVETALPQEKPAQDTLLAAPQLDLTLLDPSEKRAVARYRELKSGLSIADNHLAEQMVKQMVDAAQTSAKAADFSAKVRKQVEAITSENRQYAAAELNRLLDATSGEQELVILKKVQADNKYLAEMQKNR